MKINQLLLSISQKIPAKLLRPRYISLIALAVLLGFWVFVPFREEGGFADYADFHRPMTDKLLAGKGYVTNDGELATRYPPGFPLLLALVDKLVFPLGVPRPLALALLYALCFCLTARIFYALAATWWQPASAFLATFGWMTYPPLLWLTTQPFTETPYLLFFFGGLCLFWRGVTQAKQLFLFACGLSLGAAALIRPMGAFAGFVLIFCLMLLRQKFRLTWKAAFLSIALMVAGQLIIWFPWQFYVYTKSRQVFFLSTALVPAMRDGLRFGVNMKGYRQRLALPADVVNLMERIHARYDEMDNSRKLLTVVTEEGGQSPLALVKLYVIKMARAWYATDSASRETPLLLLQLVYLFLFGLGAWRSYRQGTFDSRWGWMIALLLLGSWGLTTLVLSILRYMTPAVGLLFLLLPGLWRGAAVAQPTPPPTPDE